MLAYVVTFLAVVVVAIILRSKRRPASSSPAVVSFIHPDLGIGGAERLVVDAAMALQGAGKKVKIYTAHHAPPHCFPETTSDLAVEVWGDWLPVSIGGRLFAVCAYIRMCYVALAMALVCPPSHVVFCDQVSACIPILRLTPAKILFYCHFPDMLLAQRPSLLKKLYRFPIDKLEELTTGLAHMVLVNSKFTQGVYHDTFTSLRTQTPPEVLYPAVPLPEPRSQSGQDASLKALPAGCYVSINRFERKKNIALALEAFIALQGTAQKEGSHIGTKQPRLVLAGGYDPLNIENKEYLDELVDRVQHAKLPFCVVTSHNEKLQKCIEERIFKASAPQEEALVWFVPSFANEQRDCLLEKCITVLYTPENEHFGIVPIEAMMGGRTVITCNSGGPLESVVDGETGFHCAPKAEDWAEAMGKILAMSDAEQKRMQTQARERAVQEFGSDSFGERLNGLVQQLIA